ncbi:MAG: DUF4926 domain-containing protein [Chloroflexi bacterium]|nr:DUF4926 domain-containing protein [Chloroflexota bacterium]
MINEYDVVVVTDDLDEFDIRAGDIATVVDLNPDHEYALIEVFSATGATIGVYPVALSAIRPLQPTDIPSVRLASSGKA